MALRLTSIGSLAECQPETYWTGTFGGKHDMNAGSSNDPRSNLSSMPEIAAINIAWPCDFYGFTTGLLT
jgi:hypothetical protein